MRFLVLLVAVAVAYAVLLQPPGCNQTAHYGLVQSLARGTPRIDRVKDETCDTAYVDGHYFAAKAPGLALATLPWFELLRAVRVVPTNPHLHAGFPQAMLALPRRALWQVGLFGAVLPALILLRLSRRVADEIAPGTGLAVAAAIGLGTLLLPFATVFFAHVLAACLGFAAFAVLLFRRSTIAAGLLAGVAICVDFSLALVAAVLLVYTWRQAPRFAAGVVAGVLPLLAFDLWAFRNPLHLSYANAVRVPGASGHDVLGANASGFFGIGVPSFRVGAELLFSPRGLLLLSPVLIAALAGLVRLGRGPHRREAIAAAAVFALFLVYNAGYYLPFGGYVPGPRFLIATIPFLGLGLAAAFAAWPFVTSVLGAFSIGAMTVATAAEPLLGNDDTHSWVVRWRHGDFARSVLTQFGIGHGWLAVLPFLAAIGVAVIAAAPRTRFALTALVPVAAVAVLFLAAPDLLHTDRAVRQSTGLVALVVLVAALIVLVVRRDRLALLAGVPLVALVVPGFASHTKQALAVSALSLVAAAASEARRRRTATPA